ncbi:MAG: hypothetical protein ACREFD_08660 [Stellaceae bacterium]
MSGNALISETALGGTRRGLPWWRLTLGAVLSLAMLTPTTGARASSNPRELLALSGEPALTSAQLAKLRGGFYVNGALFQIGFDVQQFVNNSLVNQVNYNVQSGTLTTNNVATNGISGPITVTTTSNDGTTQLSVTVSNGAVQTVVQNTANNRALQTITTLNVATQGEAQNIRNFIIGRNLANIIQSNAWMHH